MFFPLLIEQVSQPYEEKEIHYNILIYDKVIQKVLYHIHTNIICFLYLYAYFMSS